MHRLRQAICLEHHDLQSEFLPPSSHTQTRGPRAENHQVKRSVGSGTLALQVLRQPLRQLVPTVEAELDQRSARDLADSVDPRHSRLPLGIDLRQARVGGLRPLRSEESGCERRDDHAVSFRLWMRCSLYGPCTVSSICVWISQAP